MYASVLHSCFARHAFLTIGLESIHQTLSIGRPGWLDIRLFAALIRNTCTFFIISDKLEVLSKLHNDGKNFTRKYHFCELLHGIVQVSEWSFDPTSLQMLLIMTMSSERASVNLRVT